MQQSLTAGSWFQGMKDEVVLTCNFATTVCDVARTAQPYSTAERHATRYSSYGVFVPRCTAVVSPLAPPPPCCQNLRRAARLQVGTLVWPKDGSQQPKV